MIINWINRRIRMTAVRGATDDFQRFVVSLRGQSDTELGMLVAFATVMRINLAYEGTLTDQFLRTDCLAPSEDIAAVQFKVSQIFRQFEKEEKLLDAAAIMVWLFTLRACNYPELRLFGREMWGELRRGFDCTDDAFLQLADVFGVRVPPQAHLMCTFIPPGLEPRAIVSRD